MQFIKSPINYTGNKYRLLPQFYQYLPEDVDVFVDLFCGGATVGCNVNAKNVIFIDNNEKVITLLEYLAQTEFDILYKQLKKIISKYRLSNSSEIPYTKYIEDCPPENRNNGLKEYNKNGFYQLRADYNSRFDKTLESSQCMLYLLMVYGFNNDFRFNRLGEFNLPVGKTDLNLQNIKKIKAFSERARQREFKFICGDFRDNEIQDIIYKANFVYADPPYLITCAVYNESDRWNLGCEQRLLDLYSTLLDLKKEFLFSNILQKVNSKNYLLCDWIAKYKNFIEVMNLQYDYKASSYNKKLRAANEEEVIVRSKYA